MKTFKDLAFEILKQANKPLHTKEITKRALRMGLVTEGKTPEATMNAQLIVDVNRLGEKSRFIKIGPSTFDINPAYKETANKKVQKAIKQERQFIISSNVSTKQKGDIAEARIAELVTLYGETSLSCYKPISDDEGIDLIVKKKDSLKTMYLQIKSRFGDNPKSIYTATVKAKTAFDHYSMALVFCFFDTSEGDLWDYLWFVPAPDFIKLANQLEGGKRLGFVAGRGKKDSNKWDEYLIDKRELAGAILKQMKRV